MPFFNTGCVRLSYEIIDRRPPWAPTTPTLLLIHGVTCSSNQWFDQVNYFAPHYRVITYDLRGHGYSSGPSAGYTIQDHVEDVLQLLSGIHEEQIHVVGSSIGGWIAQQVADRLSEKIKSLVLVGTSSHTTDDIPFLLSQIEKLGVADFLKTSFPSVMFSKEADPRVVEHVLQVALSIPPHLVRNFFEETLLYDGDATAKNLQCPTLVIVGDTDQVSPPTCSFELRRLIPQSQLAIIPDCGHFPHLEVPDIFNQIVYRFLRQQK